MAAAQEVGGQAGPGSRAGEAVSAAGAPALLYLLRRLKLCKESNLSKDCRRLLFWKLVRRMGQPRWGRTKQGGFRWPTFRIVLAAGGCRRAHSGGCRRRDGDAGHGAGAAAGCPRRAACQDRPRAVRIKLGHGLDISMPLAS